MVQCLANIEAVIDFGEDEEIAEEVAQQVLPRMQALQKQLQHHLLTGKAPHSMLMNHMMILELCCHMTSLTPYTLPLDGRPYFNVDATSYH